MREGREEHREGGERGGREAREEDRGGGERGWREGAVGAVVFRQVTGY